MTTMTTYVNLHVYTHSAPVSRVASADLLVRLGRTGIAAILEIRGDRMRIRFDDHVIATDSFVEDHDAVARVRSTIEDWATSVGIGTSLISESRLTLDEYNRSIREPEVPELVGIAEIAELLGVSRQRASELADTGRLGNPAARIAATRVWAKSSILSSLEGTHGASKLTRRPGRPSKKVGRAVDTAEARTRTGPIVRTREGGVGRDQPQILVGSELGLSENKIETFEAMQITLADELFPANEWGLVIDELAS
jgi:hypothetical protein